MVKIGRRGSLNGTLRVAGRQGHVAYPALADNPSSPAGCAAGCSACTCSSWTKGTDHFQPSRLELTSIDVGNAATNVIPGSAAARFNVRFNDRHTGASLERHHPRLPGCRGRALRARHRGLGRGLPDPAGPAQLDHRGFRRRRDGHDTHPQHHRRHVGRALHQGSLPRRRVRSPQPDHAPHRRMRAGGRAGAASRTSTSASWSAISPAPDSPA